MKHHVIVVPGLGGENGIFRYIINSWKQYGLVPHIHDFVWKDKAHFQPKLQGLLSQIDELKEKDNKISLIGTSAGGSAVLNAFIERKDKIHKVVNICGRLQAGYNVFPSLQLAAGKSPAFEESVKLFGNREPLLTNEDRVRILTIRALFDEIVPTSTIPIEGAKNIRIYSIEHMLSIALAMTLYSRQIINFLQY